MSRQMYTRGAGSVLAGQHTLSVLFEEQTFHENFVGHDVNHVRLDDGADVGAIEAWM